MVASLAKSSLRYLSAWLLWTAPLSKFCLKEISFYVRIMYFLVIFAFSGNIIFVNSYYLVCVYLKHTSVKELS